MNETIKAIYERKSVRAYSDEPITKEERRILLESAIQAPTAGNMALYSLIDVQDQKLKEQLAQLCDHQSFIAKASMVCIFLVDYQKWYDIFTEYNDEKINIEESDFILAGQDTVIAAQNMVVAAQSLGIGSCYIGDILENFEILQEIFNLPQYAVPYTMVVLGKPNQQQKERVKPKRFTVEDIVHQNYYHQKTILETKQMFMKQTNKDEEELKTYIQAFTKRKFFAEFRQEMNRSVRAMLKHWIK